MLARRRASPPKGSIITIPEPVAPAATTPVPVVVVSMAASAPALVAAIPQPVVDTPTEPTVLEPSYSATPTVAIVPLQDARATILGVAPLRPPAAPIVPLMIRSERTVVAEPRGLLARLFAALARWWR